MTALARMRSALRNLLRRNSVEQDLDDELRAYVDLLAAEKLRAGLSPEAARRQALVDAGGVEQVKEEVRDARAGARLESLVRDLSHTLRGLGRAPGFTLAVIATLTIGIGLDAAVTTLVYSVLARPLPVRDADRIVNVYQRLRSAGPKGREIQGNTSFLSYAEFQAYAKAPAFASAAVYHAQGLSVAGATDGTLPSELVSCDYFRTLDARIVLGRSFTSDDCTHVGAGPFVVLSNSTWRAEYGADSSIVGRVLRVNGLPLTVVGVAEPGFNGISIAPASLWVPVTMQPALEHGRDSILLRDNASWLMMAARLAPGATLSEARSQVAVIGARLDAATPGRVTIPTVPRGALINFPEVSNEGAVPLALTLLLGFTIVAMACANVLGLMLARGLARRREIAIRLAIGASRAQLIRQLLIESGVLALGGGTIGMAFVLALPRVLRAFAPVGPMQVDVSPDARIVAYVFAVAIAAMLLVGLTPALQSTRVDLASAFKGSVTFRRRQVRPSRIRNAVVGVQIAGSAMLLVIAALFLRGALRATNVNPGFATHNVVAFSTNAAPLGYDVQRAGVVYGELMERIRRVPGVVDVALAARLPLLSRSMNGFRLEGESAEKPMHVADVADVSASYFHTMDIRIVRGATFDSTATANADGDRQAVISQSMAAKYWPGEEAIGKRFGTPGRWNRVVGIASDAASSSLARTNDAIAYLAADSPLERQIIVRTNGSTAELTTAVPGWARSLDPELAVRAERFEERIALVLLPARLIAGATASLGAMALLLAAIGIAGVVSFGFGQRRREVAVRLAVGASGRQVVALMMRQGATPIVAGVGSGMIIAALLAQLIRKALFGVSPVDPLTYLVMIVALGGTGVLATFLPSRRAAGVDPASTLRDDG